MRIRGLNQRSGPRAIVTLIIGMLGLVLVFPESGKGQCVEQATLTASDADAGDKFSVGLGASANVIVVGAWGDDCASGIDCGAAYVFRRNGSNWDEEAKLTASDAAAEDGFGSSVAIDGETVIVGATGDDCVGGTFCGAAYVFRFDGSTWVEEQKITASDGAVSDFFGTTVSAGNNVLAVGAENVDCADGADCGAVYMYRFDGLLWVEEQKLMASDASAGDVFRFVSLADNTAIIGAPSDDCTVGANCGAAYIFRFNGSNWVQEQKLVAADVSAGDNFGFVSLRSPLSICRNI